MKIINNGRKRKKRRERRKEERKKNSSEYKYMLYSLMNIKKIWKSINKIINLDCFGEVRIGIENGKYLRSQYKCFVYTTLFTRFLLYVYIYIYIYICVSVCCFCVVLVHKSCPTLLQLHGLYRPGL